MIALGSGEYFGVVATRTKIGPFSITETRYRPGERLPRHCHAQAYVFVPLDGALQERSLGSPHLCTRGWVVYNEAGESHEDLVLERGARGLNIELPPEWVAQSKDEASDREPLAYAQCGATLPAVGVLEAAVRSKDCLAPLAVEEAVASLVHGLDARFCLPGGRPERSRVGELVRERLHERPACPPSMAELVRLTGMHPGHLCREFRRASGVTIAGYARRLRADRALTAVLEGRRTLAVISAACGYADQSHMTREFRRFFGVPPARLRRACRANAVQDRAGSLP